MKQISARDFCLHPKQYLKELPLVLTQYNKPVAILSAYVELNQQPSSPKMINLTSVATPEPGVLPIEEPNNDYPTSYLGKPLSGRKASCPVCYEEAPVEFANAHYAKKHGDI